MTASRVVQRDSVFLTNPKTLAVTRFVKGDEIPASFGEVGEHLFEEEPDWSGTPQTSSFGRVLPFGPEPTAATSGAGGYDPGDHTVAEVLDYVGDDQAKAAAVLAAEQDGENRKGIVEKLEPIANP